MRYLVQAKSGRRVGAIGITHPIAVYVEADNADAALIEAYNYIEHLAGVTVEPEKTSWLDGRSDLVEAKKRIPPTPTH